MRFLLPLVLALPLFAATAVVQQRGDPGNGACNDSGGFGTTITCAFSSTPTPGNAVIATCFTYNTSCVVSDNAGTDTYTQVTLVAGSGTGTILNGCLESADTHKVVCIFYSLNVQGSATLKYTTLAVSYLIGHQYEVSGLATSSAYDVTGSNSLDTSQTGPTTVSPSNPSSSTAQNNEFFIQPCAFENATTPTAGTGYTLGMSDTSLSVLAVAGSDQYSTSNTAGTQTAQMNLSITVASGYTCAFAAFKQPAAATYVSNPTVIVVGP